MVLLVAMVAGKRDAVGAGRGWDGEWVVSVWSFPTEK